MWIALLFAEPAHAQDVLAVALAEKGKPSWEPKGRSFELYGRGDTKRGTQAWDDAIALQIEALGAQPGCGKCLQSLSRSLSGAKRYEEAVKVADHLTALFPDHKEGPYYSAQAHMAAREPEAAIPSWDKYLQIDTAGVVGWHQRNLAYLTLEQNDEADKALATAPAALAEATRVCLEIEVLLSRGSVDEARLKFPRCDEGGDVDVQRLVEGFLLLQEGKSSEAQNKLAQGGGEADSRLALATVRLSEGKYDQAVNLTTKLVAEEPWALDAQVTHARALFGLNKVDEALAVLDGRLTRPGWESEHLKYTRNEVLLFLGAPKRQFDVGVEAIALKVLLLNSKGDAAGAEALRLAGVKVHGENPLLPPPVAPTPAPAPPPKK